MLQYPGQAQAAPQDPRAMGLIRLLIVEDHGETVDIVRKLLHFERDIKVIGVARTGGQAIAMATELQPDIILLDINLPDMDGLSAAEQIVSRQFTRIIVMSVQSDPVYMDRAMSVGARGYLVKPFNTDRLASTIRKAYVRTDPQVGPQSSPRSMPTGGPVSMPGPYSQQFSPQQAASLRTIISVYSPKGGVGTSVVAANLAIAIRQQTRRRVALVDANLQGGDAHILLNINTQSSIDDLRGGGPHGIDQESVQNAVIVHEPSGISLLRAPLRPEAAEYFNNTPDAMRAILVEMRDHFDYLVVDTDTPYSETTLTMLEMADQVVALTTLEVPSIHRISQFFRVLEGVQVGTEKVSLVCNRVDTYYNIKPQQVEAQLRIRFRALLPEDNRLVVTSVNQGIPFLLSQRGAPISRAVNTLAERLLAPAPNGRRRNT
ncbi:MAG TPA: response regulator [Ktedonobacterales bacterium]|nr:response regulator [Ktedonobacterales bacterium]